MTAALFTIAREDGRSNAQVLADLVAATAPGRVLTFGEIAAALNVGTVRRYAIPDVRRIAMQAYPQLLKSQRRALHSIRGVGYRVAEAGDHHRLALQRQQRSDLQMRRGLQTLEHVHWDELGAEARKLHEGTLMVVSAMYAQQRAMERRLSRTEEIVEKLIQKHGEPED